MKKNLNLILALVLFAALAVFLKLVFSGHVILGQSFNIGPLTIHYYGIIMAVAAAAGFYLALKRTTQYGIDEKKAEDILFWVIVGGFIGARVYHVLSSAEYYYQHPIDIVKVWNGGLSIYGALLGGILAVIIFKRLYNPFGFRSGQALQLTTYNLLDWLAPSLILGQIIGRFGNLFNYEAFGYPTGLPWKMFVPVQFRPGTFIGASYFHPFFLYEALGNLIILIFLLKIFKFKQPGALFFSYVLLYNMLRFSLEFLRIDSTFIHGYRLNGVVSLGLIVTAAAALFYISRRKNYAETP